MLPGVDVLLREHRYDAAATLLREEAARRPSAALFRARDLSDLATRALELDAEDFATLAAGFERPWTDGLVAASFPAEPRDPQRGALGSLVSLFELMLEVVELRAARREPLFVVMTAHLMGEYLKQLAWEPRLGHAGDPLRLGADVGERWGSDDKTCSHPSALRATARRALHACSGDTEGYLGYLDRFHSRQGEALAVCAMNHKTVRAGRRPDAGPGCARPCGWALAGSEEERLALDGRCRLALLYADSPLVRLRHHAPVGHFFGVPSRDQIDDAWARSWERLTEQWPDGGNPLADVARGGEPGRTVEALPGMAALVSAVGAQEMGPGRLIRDIGDDIRAALE